MPVVNPGIRRFLGSAIQRLFNSASFAAPLTHTAVPQRAAPGTTATFTRATTATVKDHEGVLRTAIAGEARFPGARRVRNLIRTDFSSENMAVNNITTFPVAITPNDITPPAGYSRADRQTSTTPASRSGAFTGSISQVTAGSKVIAQCVAKAGSGRYLCFGDSSDSNWHVMTLDTQTGNVTSGASGSTGTGSAVELGDGWWELTLKFTKDITGVVGVLCCHADVASNSAYPFIGAGEYWWATGFMIEDITGRTDQTTPSEYVSVGVESAPYYHGAGVDGVKYFDTDLSGNPLPTAYTYDAVSLNGVAGTYVSTPDSVAASITGDIDIRVKAALTDWTDAAEPFVISKYAGAGSRSWFIYARAGGAISFRVSLDGTATALATSTAATGFADGSVNWLRVTRAAASGNVNFYTSSDGVSWVLLGVADQATTAGTIFDSAAPIELGAGAGGTGPLSGYIYRAQIYNGIDGTLAVDFDASRYAGGTTLTGSTGETWTLQGNAVIHPTNNPMLGYSAEGARTNLALGSNDLANPAYWTVFETTATANQAVGSDGATSLAKVAETAVTQVHLIRTVNTPTAINSVYTGSIELKEGTQRYATLLLWGVTSSTELEKFTVDLQTGTKTTAGTVPANCLIEATANGTYRCKITGTTTGTDINVNLYVYLSNNGTNNPSYAGDTGKYIYAGKGQVELGSFASSYIATTTIAVARNADVEAVSTSGNIAAAAGSVYLEYTPTHSPSGTIAFWGTYVDASNYTAIIHDATNLIFRKRIAGVNYDATIANAFVSGTTYKACATWGASGTSITLNGTEGTPHANTTAAQIAATMQWGADGNSLQQPFASVRNCRDWLRQLSASERAAVTA